MPSHLSRYVFRQLLANEPIVHRACLRRHAHYGHSNTILRRHAHTSTRLPRRPFLQHASTQAAVPPRRTFFNFNMFARKRDVKEPDLDPGVEKMMELDKMQRLRARLPPKADVAEALQKFFAKRSQPTKRPEPIEDTHAQLALQSLRYCFQADHAPLDPKPSHALLRAAHKVLRQKPRVTTDAHIALAKTLLDLDVHRWTPPSAYVLQLCWARRAREARDFVVQYEASPPPAAITVDGGAPETPEVHSQTADDSAHSENHLATARRHDIISNLWLIVLQGFARGGNEADLLTTLDTLRLHHTRTSLGSVIPVLEFYLRKKDVEAVRTWYSKIWRECGKEAAKKPALVGVALKGVFRWCLEHDQKDFGHDVVRQAMANNPHKLVWDAVFVWAAGTGKGADEIDRMMTVMENSNERISESNQWRQPDIGTINALVEHATSKNDPYQAERFIALGKERNILPDAQTYILQMEYRLKSADVDGALIAYKNLQSMDLSSNEDLPTVNKLIVALCESERHDFDTIMNVAADLSDRRARFEPLTVSTLALLHLNRDEVADVLDLLNTHAYHYSSSERERIRNNIVAFCVDLKTPTSRSWDAYTILRSVFDEMSRTQRTDIMTSMFRKERPDMAVHIFNSMRTHSRADTIPTVDTYVAAFLGSARLQDLESLEVIHNQLKLDYNIDVNTYLNNALIIAYTACGKPRQALDFWDDVIASKEGPTYNTIHVALRACERAPFGDLKAQEIWEKLRKQNVDRDQTMWASYAGALTGNGDNENAISVLERGDAANEVELDAFVIGSLLNGSPGWEKQAEIEEWARTKHPHVWTELETIGFEIDEVQLKRAKIDRSVTP